MELSNSNIRQHLKQPIPTGINRHHLHTSSPCAMFTLVSLLLPGRSLEGVAPVAVPALKVGHDTTLHPFHCSEEGSEERGETQPQLGFFCSGSSMRAHSSGIFLKFANPVCSIYN